MTNTEKSSIAQPRTRMFWLDVARAVAVISITTNHALNRSWAMDEGSVAELHTISLASTLLKTFFSIFSRLGVPLFLMISGALLLRKSYETGDQIKRFYKHNWLNLLITSEIWYFIMYWFIVFFKPLNIIWEHYGFWGSLRRMFPTLLFSQQVTLGSMWYIPMILAVYTVIPLFATGLNHMQEKRLLVIPCTLVVIYSMVVPNLNSFFKLAGIDASLSFSLKSSNVFSMYMIYLLAGYWISQGGLKRLPTWGIGLGFVTSFASLCAYQLWAFSRTYVYLVAYESLGILICVIFLFELLRRTGDWLHRLEKPITWLSTRAFAIYFVHIVIMEAMYWHFPLSQFPPSVVFWILELSSFLGSVVVIQLLSRFRWCRKYLFVIKA